ncbi:hypothetical protein [Membranihabitans maritimus]|uniref:hypothetical protein n=1 Tax=Membranihabitans maritimus TaxID=2904244 RepID=UPI001F3E93EB|nr:hypothetical protein [Membranihabitans maritimus]
MDNLRDKLNNARVAPDPKVWQKVEHNLSIEQFHKKNHRTRRWIGIAAGIFLLFACWTLAEIYDKNSYHLENLNIDHSLAAYDEFPSGNLNKNIDKYEVQTSGKLLPNYKLLSEKPLVANTVVQ